MRVDVHSHTPRFKDEPPAGEVRMNAMWRPDVARPAQHTWKSHLEAMEPVDKAIVFNMGADPRPDMPVGMSIGVSGRRPSNEINDETAEFVRAHPEKFIGFMTVHPPDPGALDEIERARTDLGLKGIKLGPNYQNFDPLSEEAMRVFKRAEELRLPVLLHQGTSPEQFADLDFAHPRHIDRVAIACPNLKMILAHLGHPWQVDCAVVIRKHPNVYADISAQFYRPWSYYNAMRTVTEWGVMHKVLFGSDYPVATPQETIDGLYRVNDPIEGTRLPPVPIDEMEKILERDALSLLEIDG